MKKKKKKSQPDKRPQDGNTHLLDRYYYSCVTKLKGIKVDDWRPNAARAQILVYGNEIHTWWAVEKIAYPIGKYNQTKIKKVISRG